MKVLFRSVAALAVLSAFSVLGAAQGRERDTAVPVATPPGITLKDAGRNQVFGDAANRTLYTYAGDTKPGVSSCVDACAKEWTPALAPTKARAFGDWTLVKRDGGAQQWAYRGKPLYAVAADTGREDIRVGAKPPVADKTWQVASFDPEVGIEAPFGIKVNEVSGVGGVAFTDATGLPLYTFEGDAERDKNTCTSGPCPNHWHPVRAAQMARGVGDFSVVSRTDGVVQWAYKGKPLYTFDGDTEPGDAAGSNVDKRWSVVMVYKYFMPPRVQVRRNHFDGYNLATDKGMTLYQRDRFRSVNGGHSLRSGSKGSIEIAHLLGTSACSGACLRDWPPLLATANDQASGNWTILTRDDGTRQWAYRSYPVYTFTGDKAPGEMNGNDIYEMTGRYVGGKDPYLDAERPRYVPTSSVDQVKGRLPVMGAPALFWHAVYP